MEMDPLLYLANVAYVQKLIDIKSKTNREMSMREYMKILNYAGIKRTHELYEEFVLMFMCEIENRKYAF